MVRPPPTSPLFPSTPLPRPSTASPPPAASDNTGIRQRRAHVDGTPLHTWTAPGPAAHGCGELNTGVAYTYTQPCAGERGLNAAMRSEEHTSELQSRQYLVCRLLLEKKNT